MASSGTTNRRDADKRRAARMKEQGIVRTTQTCPVCYRSISCESSKSRYTHICKG